MKDILVYNDNGSIFGIGKIELGFFENDPEEESYKITLESGEVYYALAQNYSKYEVDDIPENEDDDRDDGRHPQSSLADDGTERRTHEEEDDASQ